MRFEYRMVEVFAQRSSPRHQFTRTRSRYSEHSPFRYMPIPIQRCQINLLQLYFRLGQSLYSLDPIPEIRLLPRHGYRSIQPLHP
jgi:hypothetical protein